MNPRCRNVVMRNVHYIAHDIIGSQTVQFNVDEMITVNHATFGNGIVKDGETAPARSTPTWGAIQRFPAARS